MELENRIAPPPANWTQIVIEEGDTEGAARARYEAEHGPIGDDNCIVFRVVVAPQGVAA